MGVAHRMHVHRGCPRTSNTRSTFSRAWRPETRNRSGTWDATGEGEFALVVSEGRHGETATAFYDLFRVSDGVIAEHWGVRELIPKRPDWKNDNGKF
jgi:predicted SnoaL-like aldol condensation-catalyzing enzyme